MTFSFVKFQGHTSTSLKLLNLNQDSYPLTKQVKDKLRNLKDAYKQACDNNKQTGKSAIFCHFYEDFDKIFGARNTVNLSYAKEVSVVGSSHHVNDAASGEATQSTNEGLVLFNFYLGGVLKLRLNS